MKAVGYKVPSSIESPESLEDITLPEPTPEGHDILVEIKAISVNPVDTKVRKNAGPLTGDYRVLGWDAAGVVKSVGSEVTLFKPGDSVWYAGDLLRNGTNAEYHLVDERVAGNMPKSLGFAEAAALPLTTITAWELLFDRLQIPAGKKFTGDSLLVIGAGGGVGSILVQLARKLTGLTVIGTASREATKKLVAEAGAHNVIDHSLPLKDELNRIGISEVSHVISLTHTDFYWTTIAEILKPQGKLALIDDFGPVDLLAMKRKSISIHWEMMYTRTLFKTEDMIAQHDLLCEAARLVDDGLIKTTVQEKFGTINAENLRRAHALLESGKSKGKIVLEGF